MMQTMSRGDLFRHDQQRVEAAWSGDTMPGPLLVGPNQKQFLHGGTGLQVATQMRERVAAVFVGDE